MEKIKQICWVIVVLIAMSIGKIIGQHYFHSQTLRHGEKTLGETAIDAPLPKTLINGMQAINVDENLYIEFDTYVNVSEDEKYVLGDWRSYDDKNELRITFVQFNKDQVKDDATFDTMTELQRQEFIKQMKTVYETGAKKMDLSVSFLEDGYFKVNDNVVIWLKGIVKMNDAMSENAFYYYVAKNRKVYTLSYFTLDSLDNQPNDTILTSLNTLKLDKIQNNNVASNTVEILPKSEINKTTKIEQQKINTSPIPSVPVYNLEHYIGTYHTGYAAYLLIDSIKSMKCTVKVTGEGNTYYIDYSFTFSNGKWHFQNSQGFEGLVDDNTPVEQNILNFCKDINCKSAETQNINSLYDDTSFGLQAAKKKLQEFHMNITNKLYRQAYDCLSNDFQKQVSFDGWVKGFNTTVSSKPYNITILPESNNESVVLTYELKAVDNPGGTTYYNGTATLINTPIGWKIDRIKNKLK